MRISQALLALSLFFFIFSFISLLLPFNIQGLQPLPAHISGDDTQIQPPLSAQPPEVLDGAGSFSGQAIPPSSADAVDESDGNIVPSAPAAEGLLRWCAVREEVEECNFATDVINQLMEYTWTCVKRETAEDCLGSIKRGEADLVNLEAGLAYTAFINYSMKAIANEIYSGQSQSYEAVAVVNRMSCERNKNISLMDFKGHKSCHGGYLTAAGWNYPINYIKTLFDTERLNDREIVGSFFSGICAPSEINGSGICNGCSGDNASCPEVGLYYGHSGAFRCLVEDLGDVAFVKGDTALLYSKEGPYNQSWSAKSIRDFMYLCPQGGCKEINGYPGDCSFGSVPANVIMAHNSIPNSKRLLVLRTLTNTTLMDALYNGKNDLNHMFSPSTQRLAIVRKLTRLYLGKSASISQSIQNSVSLDDLTASSTANEVSDETSSSSINNSLQVTATLPTLILPLVLGVLSLI